MLQEVSHMIILRVGAANARPHGPCSLIQAAYQACDAPTADDRARLLLTNFGPHTRGLLVGALEATVVQQKGCLCHTSQRACDRLNVAGWTQGGPPHQAILVTPSHQNHPHHDHFPQTSSGCRAASGLSCMFVNWPSSWRYTGSESGPCMACDQAAAVCQLRERHIV